MWLYRISLCLCLAAPLGLAQERPVIQASDVVFMYVPNDPGQYDTYQGTVTGWGGRSRSRDAKDVENFRKRVEEAHNHGMKYCGSVDYLVDFAGYIDFNPERFMDAVCRGLDGNPLRVPWLWDHKHKGHPSYWFCTNNPDHQAYIRDQVERACLAPIDGLHIDDYSGTSACSDYNGGCFCPVCMEGFRGYLKKRFSSEELKEKGISDADSFDYQAFLKSKGVTNEQYRRQHWQCPLVTEFQDYQNECMQERIRATFEYAEQLRGRPLLRSVNSHAGSPRTLLPAPIIDYFCGEVSHQAASEQVSRGPVFVYRLVEAAGRRQTATASGQDWAWIKAHEKPGLVRTWIAQAYAHGSVFMVPHRQWCYTQELGTHWWNGKPEDFADLYQFVRENRALLDGYNSLANTAVLCTDSGFNAMEDAAGELTRANIPHDLIYVSNTQENEDELIHQLFRYESVITSQSDNLPQVERTRYLAWNGLSECPAEIKQSVSVDGAERIAVSLRYNPDRNDAPVVCHVLNQNYDVQKDTAAPVTIRLNLREDLFKKATGGRALQSAVLHEPKTESREIELKKEGGSYLFTLENLGLWGMVELK
ncbi:MAG: hypothetical protein ACE15F_08325 [bacterium]